MSSVRTQTINMFSAGTTSNISNKNSNIASIIITFVKVQLFFKSQYLHPRFSSHKGHIRKVQFLAEHISMLHKN